MRDGELVRVGGYERSVRASLERVWENVLDWEHLPWLHREAFRSIACEDAGDWGWRARVGMASDRAVREVRIELLIEREALRYVTRTLDGMGRGTEIWTRLRPEGPEQTGIEVSFLLPGVPPAKRDALGARYRKLYAQLWDEDEEMMRVRSAELVRLAGPRPPANARLRLGDAGALRLPLCAELGGRRWRVVRVGGELLAHATTCPHRLGPLDAAPVEGGQVRCPWHGYRFDVRTGRAAEGRGLRLPEAPRVEREGDGLWLVSR